MKKTLTLGFERRPQFNSNFVQTIYSIYVNIKLHTKNQPPSLVNSGYSYEELNIRVWKTNSS